MIKLGITKRKKLNLNEASYTTDQIIGDKFDKIIVITMEHSKNISEKRLVKVRDELKKLCNGNVVITQLNNAIVDKTTWWYLY